ncbi:MAG: DUF1697 domain-containing protein [Abditibacteriaceae bacterium]
MQHIAFLRGINVGNAKRVAMSDLRAIAEDLGYTKVCTLRNSGNLIFETTSAKGKAASKKIENELKARLDVSSRIIILTEKELDAIIEENPLAEVATNPSRYLVVIVGNPDDLSQLRPITKKGWEPEAIEVDKRVAYLWCPDGILESPLAKAINGKSGQNVTTRNWATLLKVHEMIHQI